MTSESRERRESALWPHPDHIDASAKTPTAEPAAVKTEVTRAICWLPAGEGWREGEYTRRDGVWSWTEETRRIIGRIGYRVTTEVIPAGESNRERLL